MRRSVRKLLVSAGALGLLAAGCGGKSDADLTIYSGRSKELVDPLIEQYRKESGRSVEVRYGDTAEMAAQIMEEGDGSPADVFFGQDAGALGALAAGGRLTKLSDAQLNKVAPAYRSVDGNWVGTSGRARVVAYNTDKLKEEDLPESIKEYTDPAWRGRIGWAPTNGSFQAFVTAFRQLEGEDGARAWLEGIKANGAKAFDNNIAVVQAVARGEIDVGFVNHYYLARMHSQNEARNVANHFSQNGDVGGLVNVAGVGIIGGTDSSEAAQQFTDFLLAESAQKFFAEKTFEVPLADGVQPVAGVPSLEDLTAPDVDLNTLKDLQGTLNLLTQLAIV
jgi:iron(III) transport system substrate-binding protein